MIDLKRTGRAQDAERLSDAARAVGRARHGGASPATLIAGPGVLPHRTPEEWLSGLEAFLEKRDGETGSVLDVRGLSVEPQDGRASPFPPRLLERHFKTLQPKLDSRLDERLEYLVDELSPGDCYYFAVYKKAQPARWCFAGVSHE